MNKVILYIFIGMLFLTACSPYGITGNPVSDSDDSESTSEEIEAMENIKTFPTELEQLEKNMLLQIKDTDLEETETGYITKDQLIQIDYKNDSTDKNEPLTNVYVLIDLPNEKFPDIEKKATTIFGMLFTSLDVSHDVNRLVTSIKENKIEDLDSEDVIVELTNNTNNIQMIISPK